MRIRIRWDANICIVSPVNKKEKLPYIHYLEQVNKDTYAITTEGRLLLGKLPEGYELVRMNKYNEIIFKKPTKCNNQ